MCKLQNVSGLRFAFFTVKLNQTKCRLSWTSAKRMHAIGRQSEVCTYIRKDMFNFCVRAMYTFTLHLYCYGCALRIFDLFFSYYFLSHHKYFGAAGEESRNTRIFIKTTEYFIQVVLKFVMALICLVRFWQG